MGGIFLKLAIFASFGNVVTEVGDFVWLWVWGFWGFVAFKLG